MKRTRLPENEAAARAPRRRGFTLIELLTVVAIVAILAAILFPVFLKAQWRSRNAVCLSNLRQLGVVLRNYADDNDDRLPVGLDTYWGDIRHVPTQDGKYLRYALADRAPAELWHCPADLGFSWWSPGFNHPFIDYRPSAFAARGQSYHYNLLFVWDPQAFRLDPIPTTRARNPAGIALLQDGHFMWHNNNNPLHPQARSKSDPPAWNVLYLDGHAQRRTVAWWQNFSVDENAWWTQMNNPRQ